MHDTTRRPGNRTQEGGFTLVEVMAGAMVLVIAAAGGLRAMVDSMKVRDVNRENSIAQLAARGAIESLYLTEFEEIFVTYNTSGDDDPGGVDTAIGANFAVFGLTPQDGDADGMVGRYEFPVDPGGAGTALIETYVDDTFGMPRDLTGDRVVDANDHAGDYRLLPVRAVIEWRSANGDARTMTFEAFLSER